MGVVRAELRGIVKRYGRFTLNIPKLEFVRGTNLIIGPNGSGKTTLAKIASGIAYPDRGVVRYFMDDGSSVGPEGMLGRISVILEEVELPPITVADLLEAYMDRSVDRRSVVEAFGLEEVLNKRYRDLSSGFKKRVQLAIGFSARSEVVFVDEPFTNIDPSFVPSLRKMLMDMSREKIVVVISHQDLGYVPTKIVLLENGRIVYDGLGEKVYMLRTRIRARVDGEVLRVNLQELNKLLEGCERRTVIEEVDTVNLVEAIMEEARKEDAKRGGAPT